MKVKVVNGIKEIEMTDEETKLMESIVDKLIADKRDRSAHGYNEYQDDTERIIHLTVAEIRILYSHFTDDDIDNY